MKLSEGYVIADSRNLPQVDNLMLLEYMRNSDSFNAAEIRGAKVLVSSRDSYVDTAVGYVEVKRTGSVCCVRCRVTPEHKIHSKMYTVSTSINEAEGIIEKVQCEDCAASQGGCKHAICVLMWLIKRAEEPPVTSLKCYWTRPKLSEAVTKDKFIMAKEIGKRSILPSQQSSANLPSFLAECKKRKLSLSLIINYNEEKNTFDKYSLFDLMLNYNSNTQICDVSMDGFKTYVENIITPQIKQDIEEETRDQANSKLWHVLRQGRITASRIFEATRCTTDGVLVQTILGGYKVPETNAIKRGKLLEGQVLEKLKMEMKVSIQKCGFLLITPFIGASPDGLCEDFTIEVKCPQSIKSMKNYVKDNQITDKFKAQVQIQMHAAGCKKALFCVADPTFETNKIIHKYWLYYDKLYCKQLLTKAELFWKTFIFDKMFKSVKL